MPNREKYLARQKRYNDSLKGQARDKRYEAKHPERKLRWEGNRNSLRRSEGI